MPALTLPRRDPTPGIHTQQRFAFGESRQQVPGSRRYRGAWHYLTGDATRQMVSVLKSGCRLQILSFRSLRELGNEIKALRFYQPIANANFKVAVPLTARSAKLAADRMFPFVRYAEKRTPQTASRLGRYLTVTIGPSYLVAGKDFK